MQAFCVGETGSNAHFTLKPRGEWDRVGLNLSSKFPAEWFCGLSAVFSPLKRSGYRANTPNAPIPLLQS